MKWSDLTLEEKAGVMSIAVNNGITSLSDIKKLYNSYAEGGNINSDIEHAVSDIYNLDFIYNNNE